MWNIFFDLFDSFYVDQKNLADKLYNEIMSFDKETILDDRDYKLGFKLKDWELIGIPYIIICGKRSNEGIVEVKNRQTNEKTEMTFDEVINLIKNL